MVPSTSFASSSFVKFQPNGRQMSLLASASSSLLPPPCISELKTAFSGSVSSVFALFFAKVFLWILMGDWTCFSFLVATAFLAKLLLGLLCVINDCISNLFLKMPLLREPRILTGHVVHSVTQLSRRRGPCDVADGSKSSHRNSTVVFVFKFS